MNEGDYADKFYVVLKGSVEVSKNKPVVDRRNTFFVTQHATLTDEDDTLKLPDEQPRKTKSKPPRRMNAKQLFMEN